MRTNGLRKSGHFALLVIILATGFVFGQNANTGEIKGTVTDSTGAVMDGVKVTITNLGPGKVKTADAGADIQGVDSTGNTQQSVTFIGDFPRCNDVSSDAPLSAGQTMHTCLTFLVPGGIKKVGYTGTEDYIGSPVTWTAK